MSAQNPTIGEVIDSRPLSGLQIFVFVACALAVFVDGYDLQSMSLAMPSIAEEWGVEPASFGWVLSGSLWGMVISALIAPLGDRHGRLPIIVVGLLLIGGSSIMTAFSGSYVELFFWRVVTGAGLGTCLANATALTSEYAPAPRRAAVMTLMGCNVGVGALVASLAAPSIVAAGGWQAIFWIGGLAPLALALVFALAVPESVRLLALLRPGAPAIVKLMSRMAPGADYALPAQPAKPARWAALASLARLIGPDYWRYTWRLWLIYSGSSFLLYLLMSWLPVLLADSGWSRPDALRGIAALQLGGIGGSIGLALLVDRGQALRALLLAFSATGTGALLFATLPSTGLVWSLVLVFTGAGLFGVTYAILAIAAKFYPPELRAAGFGSAAAVARTGAIVGPLAGGAMLQSGLDPRLIVASLAGPALICILASLTLRKVMADGRAPTESAKTEPKPQEAVP